MDRKQIKIEFNYGMGNGNGIGIFFLLTELNATSAAASRPFFLKNFFSFLTNLYKCFANFLCALNGEPASAVIMMKQITINKIKAHRSNWYEMERLFGRSNIFNLIADWWVADFDWIGFGLINWFGIYLFNNFINFKIFSSSSSFVRSKIHTKNSFRK